MEDVKVIEAFLKPRNIGYGSGYGYGSGDGYGPGDGYGYGSGDGYGYGSGDGDGYGSGYGSGSGDGSGSGSGDGYGSGYGSGSGDGYGYGSGYGIKSINGEKVWMVDDTATLIDSVHGDYALGRMLNFDLTFTPCYIARVENSFAHGDTLKKALADAESKAMEDLPIEGRIDRFKAVFPSLETKAKCSEFYRWHHTLTGSCTMGRDQFIREHGLDMDEEYTVRYFLGITKAAYGGDVIRRLFESYE